MYRNLKLVLVFLTGFSLLFNLAATAVAIEAPDEVEYEAEPLVRRGDSTTYTNDTQFKNNMLAGHRYFRTQHGVAPFTWNDTRAAASKAHAAKCAFRHSGVRGAGENIAIGYTNVGNVVNAWGLERLKYNWSSPGFTSATGHFTQVVWKASTQLGCGRAKCSGRWFVVCQYTPAGNVLPATNFRNNVLRQIKGVPTDKYTPSVSAVPRSVEWTA